MLPMFLTERVLELYMGLAFRYHLHRGSWLGQAGSGCDFL